MPPLVSVILAVYNEEKHLRESLNSLLGQTYQPYEIIAVDDGSTDRTAALFKSAPEVRLIRQKHLGLGAARNCGAGAARGEILVFADGDLVYDRNYLRFLVNPILKGKAVGSFHSEEMVKNSDNFWSAGWQINDHLPRERRIPGGVGQKSIFFRAIKKSVFLKAGGFDKAGYLDDRTLAPKLGKMAVRAKKAVCYHYNPESALEVFREARWHGRALARENFWRAVFRYSLVNTCRRIILDSLSSGSYLYFIFKLVYDAGVNLGIIEYLTKRTLAK